MFYSYINPAPNFYRNLSLYPLVFQALELRSGEGGRGSVLLKAPYSIPLTQWMRSQSLISENWPTLRSPKRTECCRLFSAQWLTLGEFPCTVQEMLSSVLVNSNYLKELTIIIVWIKWQETSQSFWNIISKVRVIIYCKFGTRKIFVAVNKSNLKETLTSEQKIYCRMFEPMEKTRKYA